MRFKLSIVILSCATVLWATDVWREKPYQQWDQADVDQILRQSPWVGSLQVESSGNTQDSAEIAWESSRTMRRAKYRQDVLRGDKPNPENLDGETGRYDLTIRPKERGPAALHAASMNAFTKASTKEIKKMRENCYLELDQSKTRIPPDRAVSGITFMRYYDAVFAVSFDFLKKTESGQPSIPENEGWVSFSCVVGKTVFKTHFDLTKMVDGEGRDCSYRVIAAFIRG